MLHIRCGTDIVAKLKATGLPGEILVWQDPVSHGPTPAAWTPEEWYSGRAAFIAAAYGCNRETIRRELQEADSALERIPAHDEVVLWFEHDLFDQSILIRLLSLIARRPRGHAALSLVSIGSHPEVPRFIGLGNLDAGQLAALFPQRRQVTEVMLAHALRVWEKFASPDPRPLSEEARGTMEGFPWLPAAMRRHLEELPWITDGLSRTERQALAALHAGAGTPAECFRDIVEMEQAPWLGDTMFYFVLERLVSRAVPCATVGARWPYDGEHYAQARATITEAGLGALRGERKAGDERERWVGGVRLAGSAGWRWDPVSQNPVPA